MKNGKKPPAAQKKLIQQWKLNPAEWLVVKDTPTEMLLVYRYNDKTTRTIPKGVKE